MRNFTYWDAQHWQADGTKVLPGTLRRLKMALCYSLGRPKDARRWKKGQCTTVLKRALFDFRLFGPSRSHAWQCTALPAWAIPASLGSPFFSRSHWCSPSMADERTHPSSRLFAYSGLRCNFSLKSFAPQPLSSYLISITTSPFFSLLIFTLNLLYKQIKTQNVDLFWIFLDEQPKITFDCNENNNYILHFFLLSNIIIINKNKTTKVWEKKKML